MPVPPSRRLTLPALALALAAGGCTPHSAAAAPARDQSAPGPVAVAYTQALISGDVPGAEQLVLPKDRATLAKVPLPKGLNVHAYGLGVGSASVKETSATVVLTGKICNTTGSRTSSPSTGSCISNADVHSTNPLFRLTLIRDTDQKWYVSLPGMPSPRASR